MWPYMEKKDRGKGGRWDPLSWRRASCRSRRGGSRHRCAAATMVVGSAHVALSSIRQSERERGGERDEERVGDADVMVHDKLKRGS
jgi:hypothetical protein